MSPPTLNPSRSVTAIPTGTPTSQRAPAIDRAAARVGAGRVGGDEHHDPRHDRRRRPRRDPSSRTPPRTPATRAPDREQRTAAADRQRQRHHQHGRRGKAARRRAGAQQPDLRLAEHRRAPRPADGPRPTSPRAPSATIARPRPYTRPTRARIHREADSRRAASTARGSPRSTRPGDDSAAAPAAGCAHVPSQAPHAPRAAPRCPPPRSSSAPRSPSRRRRPDRPHARVHRPAAPTRARSSRSTCARAGFRSATTSSPPDRSAPHGRVARRAHVICTIIDRSYEGQDCDFVLVFRDGTITASGGGLDRLPARTAAIAAARSRRVRHHRRHRRLPRRVGNPLNANPRQPADAHPHPLT